MNHPKGSLWRKWDLHVHTPASIHQNYGGDSEEVWERFISELEALPPSFSVIGINDYLFLDGYQRVTEYKSQGRLQNIVTFLPVLEFRIARFAGTDSKLRRANFHVIFSNQISTATIQQQFLNQLQAKYTLSPVEGFEWAGVVTRDSLADLGRAIIESAPETERDKYGPPLLEGFRNLNLPVEAIRAALESPYFSNGYLTAIGKAEWESIRWNDQSIAEKKTLINSCDIVFTASENAAAYANARAKLSEQEVNSKLLDCSDAHTWPDATEKDSLGRCDCWLKADPTFRGLQHALLEFEDRVYVGTEPPKQVDVRSRPQKYIDSIAVTKAAGTTLTEHWFDADVPVNPGLVAIIGNKGSGKSALADIIALGGNSLQEDHYSFLNDRKFRRPRENKSDHFTATLTWCSKDKRDYRLSESPDNEDVERVRYIPQSYLERLCNEFTAQGGSAFDKELRSVIFSHIPTAQRLGKASLDALLAYLGEETLVRINALKGELSKTNREIASLEEHVAPEYKSEVQKRLTARLRELDILKAAQPPEVPKPEADPATKSVVEKLQADIEAERAKVTELESAVETAHQERRDLLTKIATADKLIERLRNLEASAQDLERESQPDLAELGFDFATLVKLEVDVGPVRDLRDELAGRESSARAEVDPENPKGKQFALTAAKQKIIQLQNQLDAPTRRYQEYLTALKDWEGAIAAIESDTDDPDSISSLKAEITRISELPQRIAELSSERLESCKAIYAKISELKEHYKRLYQPVQDFIQGHHTLAESIQLSFDVRISDKGVADGITEWVHQGKSGSFQGTEEGTTRLKEIVKRNAFDTPEGVEAFLGEIMHALQNDTRHEGSKPMSTGSQLKANRSAAEFYDYLYGLDYLEPRYALKMEGKELFELSPGERGLLLLLFYLLVEKTDGPLILDQPEENLDNETVHEVLVPSLQLAKQRRQIIIVTHNPNLAVVADADQVIAAGIDKKDGCRARYESGALENPTVNQHVVRYLEGTLPAFMNRDRKYIRQTS